MTIAAPILCKREQIVGRGFSPDMVAGRLNNNYTRRDQLIFDSSSRSASSRRRTNRMICDEHRNVHHAPPHHPVRGEGRGEGRGDGRFQGSQL